jgi:hypothetical protein
MERWYFGKSFWGRSLILYVPGIGMTGILGFFSFGYWLLVGVTYWDCDGFIVYVGRQKFL